MIAALLTARVAAGPDHRYRAPSSCFSLENPAEWTEGTLFLNTAALSMVLRATTAHENLYAAGSKPCQQAEVGERLVRRLKRLGYAVELKPMAQAA